MVCAKRGISWEPSTETSNFSRIIQNRCVFKELYTWTLPQVHKPVLLLYIFFPTFSHRGVHSCESWRAPSLGPAVETSRRVFGESFGRARSVCCCMRHLVRCFLDAFVRLRLWIFKQATFHAIIVMNVRATVFQCLGTAKVVYQQLSIFVADWLCLHENSRETAYWLR